MQANEEHKLHPTQHKTKHNIYCMQQHKKIRKACGWTWTTCYTKHNTTQVDREAHGWSELGPHAHATWQSMKHECPNLDTEPKLSLNKTWVLGSEHHAPTWNRTRRWECTRSRMLTSKQRHDGVSGISRPKWQNPDNNVMITLYF